METLLICRECGSALEAKHLSKKFCSVKCKTAHNKKNGRRRDDGGICRQCGKPFPRGPGQNAKAVCSPECRRARLAESVRTFHLRKPAMESIYRKRTREKLGADSQLRRFYRWNPTAPHSCESCGEARVLEIAHKPEHPRLGERRSRLNYKWPEFVWVLCPTCHRLLDRMNYTPEDLGLTAAAAGSNSL